jgi:hypothetical protein
MSRNVGDLDRAEDLVDAGLVALSRRTCAAQEPRADVRRWPGPGVEQVGALQDHPTARDATYEHRLAFMLVSGVR